MNHGPTTVSTFQKPLDIHVHIVGTGAGGTGCRLRMRAWQRAFSGFMLRGIGLPTSALRGDFDRLYAEQLLHWVRGSSLGAAVILAQDEVLDSQGKVLGEGGSHYVPNDYVFKLAGEHAEFLPGISIHPARPDALEELERCLAAGAVLMKCLPNCQNIDCADRRFTRFWERMAEARLPLLAHTGGEHTLPVVRREFSDPRTLVRPLEIGVPVIAAHCAGKSGITDPEYFPVLIEMMRRFPNCYADISALNIPLRSRLLWRCREPEIAQRLVHGSDYPVPISGVYAWMRGLINWRAFRMCARVPNPLEGDYMLKRAMGIHPAVFTRGWELLRGQRSAGSGRYEKTGPSSQRVAERPGEFSNQYNQQDWEELGRGLYKSKTESWWSVARRNQRSIAIECGVRQMKPKIGPRVKGATQSIRLDAEGN